MNKTMSVLLSLLLVFSLTPPAFAEEITDIVLEDIPEYTGRFGPSSGLMYGFKLMLENVDESLTFNTMRKLEKKAMYAQRRLSEAKGEITQNRLEAFERVMALYSEKITDVETSLNETTTPTTDLENRLNTIQLRIEQQKMVLTQLKLKNPSSAWLNNAIEKAARIESALETQTGRKITGSLKNGV